MIMHNRFWLSHDSSEYLLRFFISFLPIYSLPLSHPPPPHSSLHASLFLSLFLPLLSLVLQELSDAPFYSDDDKGSDDEDEDDDSEDDSEGEGKKKKAPKKKPYVMDSDHRLLLRNCKPLLQSRNASVRY